MFSPDHLDVHLDVSAEWAHGDVTQEVTSARQTTGGGAQAARQMFGGTELANHNGTPDHRTFMAAGVIASD